jgi:hypothetical protein
MDDIPMENAPQTLPGQPNLSNPRPILLSRSLAPKPRPKSTDPAFFGCIVKHKLKEYTVCERAPNTKGKTSFIWEWGAGLRPLVKPKTTEWLCCICWDQNTIYMQGTQAARVIIHHLNKVHLIGKGGEVVDELPPALDQRQTAAEESPALSLAAQINLNAFKRAHVPLTGVRNPLFVKLLNPVIFEYLWRRGNDIRSFILQDFEERKKAVKEDLRLAKSKIHIGFELWTSQNSLATVGVVAHYLTKDLAVRSLLIGFREITGARSGETTAVRVAEVITEMVILGNIGYVISDKVASNVVVVAVCRELSLASLVVPRSRQPDLIITPSATQALFGRNEGNFDFAVSEITRMKFQVHRALEFVISWSKKCVISKLHNVVNWIQKSPQRVQKFKDITSDIVVTRNGTCSFSQFKRH